MYLVVCDDHTQVLTVRVVHGMVVAVVDVKVIAGVLEYS